MNITTADWRISPTQASHLEVGALYRFTGTADGVLRVPPQLVRIEGPVRGGGLAGMWVPVTQWVIITDEMGNARHTKCWQGTLALDQVNIPEHGLHDRHLVRVRDDIARAFGLMRAEERKQAYLEESEG